jgi:PAS domain S-box-containing protein
MQDALELCPDMLRSVEASGDPIFVVGERWDILHWNRAAEAAFGKTAEDVRGRQCYDVIAGIDDSGREICRLHCEKWALARRGAKIRAFDVRALPTHERWANVAILPVIDDVGRPYALVHVLRNVERAKRIERFVRELAVGAEDVLEAKAGNGNGNGNGNGHEPEPVHLTIRELEVLGLLAHGAGTNAIAERLGVSRHTVHNHIAVVLNKLGVHSRAEAVAYAFEHHLA